MRKLLILILTFTALLTKAQTSVYHIFPDSSAMWNIHWGYNCITGYSSSFYSIVITGDTLINSQVFHKLYTPHVLNVPDFFCDVPGSIAGYKGAIKQDTAAKKVFFVPPAENAEQLLYDFNLQVGDTVKGFLEPYTSWNEIVQAIDSVLVDNNYRKRWYINSMYEIYFIEGIGSTFGLIERLPGYVSDYGGYDITCFTQNGNALFPDMTTNCELISTINSVEPILNQVKVFPNPSNGSFTVDFGKATNIREIRLTDLLGNIVIQQQTINQKKINIDNFPSGSYILKVIDKEDRTTSIKIISCP